MMIDSQVSARGSPRFARHGLPRPGALLLGSLPCRSLAGRGSGRPTRVRGGEVMGARCRGAVAGLAGVCSCRCPSLAAWWGRGHCTCQQPGLQRGLWRRRSGSFAEGVGEVCFSNGFFLIFFTFCLYNG